MEQTTIFPEYLFPAGSPLFDQQKDQQLEDTTATYLYDQSSPIVDTFGQPTFDDTNFYYSIPATHPYTPSYGSPQSSIYESPLESSSYSDYEPSDGYSTTSSGLPSPHLTTEVLSGLEYQQYQQEQATAFTLSMQTDDIKMENPFRQLKLDTNVSGLEEEPDQGGSGDFLGLSPNTFAQCLQVSDAASGGPVFSFIPPTPITPTKAQALADSLYGVINPLPPITDHTQLPIESTSSKPVSRGNTGNSAANTADVNNKSSDSGNNQTQDHSRQHSHKSSSSNRSSTPTHHNHRSHRKQLPQEMAERLHTMNLAPPKPQRKSKTAAPFHCPYEDCSKTFTRQYNLKSHLRTHTDERPFLCGYQGCTRAFARQHDRKRHYNLHLGFKPHVCSHCGRAFARLDALNRHLRSDSGAPCAQATLPQGGAKKFKPVNM